MPNNTVSLINKELTPCDSNLEILINEWLIRLHDAQVGHYVTAESLYKKSDRLGYLLIISTTIVTAMLFMDTEGVEKIILIIMSIISASLSGIVSFGRFSEKAEQHRAAAGLYGKLRRQLEKLSKTNGMSLEEVNSKLKILRIEWEYVSQSAPLTPRKSIQRANKQSRD
ncbi:SLATT domain-containing protein [Providencia rettgeri]|uniref:SLATT domain-containing protein n=1 Tax=Providencia rettgeri TaxID=587 RepID=UPI0010102561|nr:SLATT domain-containing protein [Providencia rettgeri]RXN73451.1 SLATT domain-containing protein [Providencia rettgeri]